jgi:uncharacterized damage-inducible protein DinB
MESPSILAGSLAAFSASVRSSTLKRFQRVQTSDWYWRPRTDLLSFADVLKHLLDADHWLFERLDGGPMSEGVVITPGAADQPDSTAAVKELARLGAEKELRIRTMTDGDFKSRQFDLGRRGIVNLAQLILRCNLDHEVQHRGSLQLSLRLRYG